MKTLGLLLLVVLASVEGSMRGGAAAVDSKGRALLEAEPAARRLPAEDIPGLKVIADFEKDTAEWGLKVIADFEKDAAGWVTDCAAQAERVVYGAPGVPPPRAGGTGMYRFRANDLTCSSFSYKIPAGGLEKGLPYHL
ncbi:hypothetical protein JKP88DRAFT_274554 [Tribonema minus]|uniref:Uncharacterized protein n=1 Tax=Tribonema minus TaxID=303371 RepID=A0A835YHY6_9STRA|nr:hypothetical protein JKP88DRAFT_274554 [Tribonema minus]